MGYDYKQNLIECLSLVTLGIQPRGDRSSSLGLNISLYFAIS